MAARPSITSSERLRCGVYAFCCRPHFVVGKSTECLGHQLKIVVEATITFDRCQAGDEAWVAVGGDELVDRVERAELDAPQLLAAKDLGREVVQRVGREAGAQPRFVGPASPVVDHVRRRLHRRRRMREVVFDDLHLGWSSAGSALFEIAALTTR